MANQDSLTVTQEKAIQLLMTGRSDQAVADELDIIHVLKAVGLYGQDMKPSGAIDSGQVERERQASDDLLKMFEVASA